MLMMELIDLFQRANFSFHSLIKNRKYFIQGPEIRVILKQFLQIRQGLPFPGRAGDAVFPFVSKPVFFQVLPGQ